MIINNVCLCRLYNFREKIISIASLVVLCFIPNMMRGQGDNRDSLIQYAQVLDSLAEYNYDQGNDSLAIALSKQCLIIRKNILGENHPDYAKSLCHITQYLDEIGYYQEAIDSITKAIDIQKTTIGTNNEDYAESLSTYAGIFHSIRNYKKAIELEEEAISIYKNLYGDNIEKYPYSLVELATYYCEIGNVQKALSLQEQVISICNRNSGGTNTPEYARALLEYAKTKSFMGYYKEAIEIGQEALSLYKLLYGDGHPSYAVALSCLGCFYSDLYNCKESIRLEQEAMEIYKEKYGDHHFNYATSLYNLAEYYSFIGDYDNALSLAYEAKDILESLYGKTDGYFISSLYHISEYHAMKGQTDKSLEIAQMAMEIANEGLNEDNNVDIDLLFNIAELSYNLGDYLTALSYGEKAAKLQKELYPSDNLVYANIINSVSVYCSKLGLYDKAHRYGKESIDIYMKKVLNNLTGNSIAQSQSLWKGIKDRFISYAGVFYRHPNSAFLPDLYDKSALFAKALQLNVDMEMRKIIFESNDSALIQKYLDLSSNKEIYNKLTELPLDEHFMDVDSLRDIIQEQDNNLIKMSKEYGDYTRRLKLSWKDIQHALQEKDIAIEFLDFPVGSDSVMYVAITIKRDFEVPVMTILFEEKQLRGVSDTLFFQSKDMTDLVWRPLLPEFKGIKNVYFSPSGALHKIGIEYLPGMEEYNLFRLSSSRELVSKKEELSEESAVLYGGLDYYAKIDSVGNSKSVSKLDFKFVDHANVRSMKLRGGKEFLPYTKEEVEKIATELCEANWTCQLDTLEKGTEESFKSLSGKRINTLHISTHGFYYTPEEADRTGYNFLRLDDHMASPEDKSLTRSGLIMSGANHILEGEELPDDAEDGILTAKEIANVDLRGLDLVVLSACQTGLGDISQGEGVFGLQRGFKKAGANSILMSLWEVDDKATQILMTQFYKNLLAGQSKRQSLLAAQKYLREVEGGKYNEPKYWASFILLDGIN